MNIKSELAKSIPWFPTFTVSMVLSAIAVAFVLSMLVIAFGEGVYLKLLFIIIGVITILTITYDNHDDDEERVVKFKKSAGTLILMLFLTEIPLFMNASYTTTYPMSIIVTEKTKNGAQIVGTDKYEQVPYKRVGFWNTETNDEVGYRYVEQDEEAELNLYINVIGKETYIDYFPFVKYSESYKYIRKDVTTKPLGATNGN